MKYDKILQTFRLLKQLKMIKYLHKLQRYYKQTLTFGSYPGQEPQVKAAGDLQQLQSLRGRAEGERDLETVVRIKHELGRPVTILEH